MKTLVALGGAAVLISAFGCNKADQTKTATSPADSNSATISLNMPMLTNQINVARATITNGAAEIKEAAGAAISDADKNLSERVRSALQSDPAFSANAENVRVTAQNGKIILRGTVNSEAEKQNIEAKAKQIVGANRLESQLQVRGNGSSDSRK